MARPWTTWSTVSAHSAPVVDERKTLALSVEGKLADVLRALAQTAADMYVQSTQVSLELMLMDRVEELRQQASLSPSRDEDRDKKRRRVPRKCLSATSLGASAMGDVDIAVDVSETALYGIGLELCQEDRETTSDRGKEEEDRGSGPGMAAADSEGWRDIDLFDDLPPPKQELRQDPGQDQKDSMVRIYEELCENEGAPFDPLVSAAVQEVHSRRRSTVRSMLRSLVLRYPLILGTSLARIEGRLQELKEGEDEPPLDELGWPDVVNFIRRAEPAHKRWLAKELSKREKGEKADD